MIKKHLHPGARWIFRIRAFLFLLSLLPVLLFFLVFYWVDFIVTFDRVSNPAWFLIIKSLPVLIIFLIFVIIISEIYARMSYNRYLFEITNEGIKIEKGIIFKKYTSIPYERVQHIDIRRGIIARIAGFSTLDIETAGKSGSTNVSPYFYFRRRNQRYESEGHIPALDIMEAEKLKSYINKHIKVSEGGL